MNNQDKLSSEQQQPAQVYETRTHRAKVDKNEQDGTRSYETQLRQTKVSKEDEGVKSFETQTYQTRLQTKDQNQPSTFQAKNETQLPEKHIPQSLRHSHNHQEALPLQSHSRQEKHEQPIHSHEHKETITLHERKPQESQERRAPQPPLRSEVLAQQTPQIQQPLQPQVQHFAQQVTIQPAKPQPQPQPVNAHLEKAQTHLKTAQESVEESVQQAQESVQQAQESVEKARKAQEAVKQAQKAQEQAKLSAQSQPKPQATVVYEVYRAKMGADELQGIQGIPSQGIQSQGIQSQGIRSQGIPSQGIQSQGIPSQGIQSQGIQSQGIQSQGTQLPGMHLPGMHVFEAINPQTAQSGGIENLATSNSWTQPLPDAQGTVIGKPNFNREEAIKDATSLLRAMKGAGTDKSTIADISGNRTLAQRQMIASEYALLDGTEKRDLLRDLKDEAGGDLESLLLPLYMMPGEFDARLLEKAMYGMKNDVEVLIEVLCTRTNKELEDMKNAWKLKIDPKVRLEEKVGDETKTWFGTTNFHVLCLKLLEAKRPPCAKPDETQVRVDAEELYHQLLERKDVNTAKAKFVEIFTERSWSHLGAVVGEFQKISEKWTMETAISHEFGDSSNTTKALQVMAEFCAQPYDFWARRLRDAMKGLGTSDNKLVRIVVSRCEVDMNNIVLVFGQRYGDGKNLKNWIEADTSGAYRQLLLNLCGYH